LAIPLRRNIYICMKTGFIILRKENIHGRHSVHTDYTKSIILLLASCIIGTKATQVTLKLFPERGNKMMVIVYYNIILLMAIFSSIFRDTNHRRPIKRL